MTNPSTQHSTQHYLLEDPSDSTSMDHFSPTEKWLHDEDESDEIRNSSNLLHSTSRDLNSSRKRVRDGSLRNLSGSPLNVSPSQITMTLPSTLAGNTGTLVYFNFDFVTFWLQKTCLLLFPLFFS